MKNPLPFCGNPLDRASESRTDPAWLAARLKEGLVLPVWQFRPLVRGGRAAFLEPALVEGGGTCVFLGLRDGQGLFAREMQGETAPALDGEFMEMRAAAFILPDTDTAICGQAKALLDWHARHGFCPKCGGETQLTDGGYRRICSACSAEHFPRTDPVAIMLPVAGDHCLIGRNQRFPEGLHSAFAGFVEPGEDMEEAVRRELAEEVGLKVGWVRYHASQPWPFPSSLMLGCYAEALSRNFQIDGNEIEAARWVSRQEVRARLKGEIQDGIKLPAPIAIAHHLIRDWAEE